MLEVADKYSEDASFVDELMKDFSKKSEELVRVIEAVLKAIQGVAQGVNEGASETTHIANNIVDITTQSNYILELSQQSKSSIEQLNEEILSFKVR